MNGVLAPGQRQVEEAETAQGAHNARSAITAAQAASETATQLSAAIEHYRDVRASIVRLRDEAEALEGRGYRMEASHSALNDARAALAAAAEALGRGELAAGPFDTARHALEMAQASGQGVVALQEQNAARLATLKTRGEEVAALIVQGRAAFDKVDEFAESAWSDIRGNGSEAQRAADEAHDAWDSANARNTMERQEFAAARDDLDNAEKLLARASELINAILQRLHDLEAARANAAAEIAAARADIEAGRAFIRANDADISSSPEVLLQRAQAQLAAAEAEAARPKPDWLALLRQAQAANADADTALANARSEAETIAKLRGEAERAHQSAAAEVQKTAQFFSIHSADMRQQSRASVASLQQLLAETEAAAQRADAAEDEARAEALRQAVDAYARVGQEAERVYGGIFNEFSQIDKLRNALERERGRARNALSEAQATLRSYNGGMTGEAVRLLERAHAAIRRIPNRVEGEESLREAISALEKATNDARTASAIIRAQGQPSSSSGGDIGSAIGGAVLGALIEGALSGGSGGSGGSHHHSSGSSDSSGSRWGGGGSSSGGSFGGGSGSGGSWGGGSGSGGGW